MTELRLAALDGNPTAEVDLDADPVAQKFAEIAYAIQQGERSIEKAIIVLKEHGRVDWEVAGTITCAEGIGLLVIASRQIERDVRDE
jgi:hypothetical protein